MMTLQNTVSGNERLSLNSEPDTQLVEPRGFNLVDLLRIVRVRQKVILGTAAIVVALVTIFVMEITPRYTATAVVMLDERKHNLEDAAAVLSGLGSDQATIQNQVQILTSLELAGRVVDKLKLDQDPEFNPKLGSFSKFARSINPLNWFAASSTQNAITGQDPEHAAVVRRFLERVGVSPIGLSTAMKVSFTSESPEKAKQIAAGIANAYVEDQLEAKFQATQKATQWLSGRISELSKKAQLADAAVQEYKAANNITTTANGVSVVEQQIADVNGQLVAARAALAEKQANYSRLAALAREGRAADSVQVLASPLIATLRAQESQLTNEMANLTSKYGPRHPKILDMQAQKANLESKIKEEVQRFVDAAKNDADVAASHVASLQASLHEAETQGAGQNRANVQLTALQSTATSARAMYEAFLGRLNQTQNQEGIQTPDARIISNPEVPQTPSFPKKGLSIGLSIPAGLILGLIIAFTMERVELGFRTTDEVESMLHVPVFSTIPEVASSPDSPINPTDHLLDKPLSSYAEAIRGVQLGLALSNVDKPPKLIIVTSSGPGEGKSTMAVSLARIAARNGQKAVVVDGDLRRPRVAKVLGLNDESQLGIVDVLSGAASLDECLVKDPRTDVMVLPCTRTPPSPADLLTSHAMETLLKDLREKFDFIFIDSAPILPVNDTKLLSLLVDAVLFVVRWEKTPRDAAITAMRSLMDVRAPVVGVALTRADHERFRYYSYGYQNYYSYSKYYSD
jgi:exopolysaccharide transport family protein